MDLGFEPIDEVGVDDVEAVADLAESLVAVPEDDGVFEGLEVEGVVVGVGSIAESELSVEVGGLVGAGEGAGAGVEAVLVAVAVVGEGDEEGGQG